MPRPDQSMVHTGVRQLAVGSRDGEIAGMLTLASLLEYVRLGARSWGSRLSSISSRPAGEATTDPWQVGARTACDRAINHYERTTSMSTDANISAQEENAEESQSRFRILVPLDGSELAAKALPLAEAICQQLPAELHLVSVLSYLVLPYVGSETYISGEVYQQLEEEREREARRYLGQTALTLREHGITVRTHLGRGEAASRILDLSKDLRMSLIVMTTHGRTGLARFALGSVADRVVRGGAAPVLLLRSFSSEPQERDVSPADLSYTLIPLDGSLQSEAPLFTIVPVLAGPVLHTITLFRVSDPRDGVDGERLCENYLTAARQRLVDSLQGRECAINTLVLGGRDPAARIVSCAREGNYNLVLMATHGEAGIGRWTLGGVADRVLRDGDTPLLLVHPSHESGEKSQPSHT